MINLKQIQAFVKVAETHSFSGSARDLYLTQPTISAHISALEKELGAKLLLRTTKEVNLTSDGELLYKYAKQMVELEKTMETLFACQENEKINEILHV